MRRYMTTTMEATAATTMAVGPLPDQSGEAVTTDQEAGGIRGV